MNVATIAGRPRIDARQTTRDDMAADFSAALATATATGTADASDDKAAAIAAAHRAIAAFDLAPTTDPSAAATYAEGARQVSVAQGLPAGTYDFTRITSRQMLIVGGALVSSGTVSAAGMAGALDLAGKDPASDTPVNFFAYLRQQAAENEKQPGGMNTAFQQQTSLTVLKRQQVAAGIAVTYDDKYPTAPRSLTADEINAKLKAAIVAFEKESSLTPAQRLRRDVLKGMDLTEDELNAMPKAERDAAEKTIGDEVARRLTLLGLSPSGGSGTAETNGAGASVAGIGGHEGGTD